PTEGAYAALLTFESGAFASILYSGYAHFDSDEFCGGISELGTLKYASHYGSARRNLKRAANARDEVALKDARNYGGSDYPKQKATPRLATADGGLRWHQH